MNLGKEMRMRRIFKKGKSIVVPVDHSLYSEPSGYLKNLPALIKLIADSKADAILITPGMLRYVSEAVGNLGIVLRIGETHTRMGHHLERTGVASTLEHALAIGADAVVINVFVGVENEDEHLEKLGKISAECFRFGMPLMAEMIPVSILYQHYGKKNNEKKDIGRDIRMVSRLAAELGADIVKTRYTGDVKSFREVVDSTPLPVLIAGGPRVNTDREFLKMVADCMEAGASGVCIGRNVWGRKDPRGILSALHAIIHEGKNVSAAERLIR